MAQKDPTNVARLPAYPGTYALVMLLETAAEIEVGKLGRAFFPAGYYIYVGSALGSGGLAGRLRRHLRPASDTTWRPRWHVDYLRRYAKITQIWYVESPIRREHDWASVFSQVPEANLNLPRFGSSDCQCPGHLFHFRQRPEVEVFRKALEKLRPDLRPHRLRALPIPL